MSDATPCNSKHSRCVLHCEWKVRVFWEFCAVKFGKNLLMFWDESNSCSFGVED